MPGSIFVPFYDENVLNSFETERESSKYLFLLYRQLLLTFDLQILPNMLLFEFCAKFKLFKMDNPQFGL